MNELSIRELQQGMADSTLSAGAAVEASLARIEALDRSGPNLNAVIEVNPQARAIAEALDRERRDRGPRGPLHGIPLLVKDNIDTADGMTTSAGSLALAGSVAREDAFLVQRLRQAGAIILGKTNLSEWANFRSTRSTSGWSSRGGQTCNPYALDRSPCGSSSGSGVAVAANLCAAAVGTETDGSIVCPAAANSLVGIKPTLGLISRSGIIPIAHSQDTAGPMARSVADAALLLTAMVGVDDQDTASAAVWRRGHTNYSQYLDVDGLRGARIGVARNFFGFHPQVDEVLEAALATMSRLGASIVDPASLDTASLLEPTETQVLLYEFKADLNVYLAGLGPEVSVHSLEELIAFNEAHRAQVMPYFGQELFLLAQDKGPLTEEPYRQALRENHRLARTEGIDAVMQEHRLDALVAPTAGPPWLIDWVNGDHYGGGCSSPAAVAGYPHITVPAGYIFGLPVGLSFFGGPFQEPTLLRLAYAFEQATHARRRPEFRGSCEADPTMTNQRMGGSAHYSTSE